MMHAARVLIASVVSILLLAPASLAAQFPSVATEPGAVFLGEVSEVTERPSPGQALSPSSSPLLFVPGQRLVVAPETELAEGLEVPSAFQPDEDRRTNLSLIAAGATLLVAGSFIDGSAGTVVMVSGALFSAVGVYRWVR